MAGIIIGGVLIAAAFIAFVWPFPNSEGFTRITEPIYYGGGLTRLPDPVLEKSYDKWAEETWEQWESGHSHYYAEPDTPPQCPKCYYVGSAMMDEYMSRAHHDSEARARWRNEMKIAQAQVEALGECRCDQKLTVGEAAFRAAEFNRPYGDFSG